MSFLHQLKRQAQELQSDKGSQQQDLASNTIATELACKAVWDYFSELPRQLNVIEPAAVQLGLDSKSLWPNMKQTDFRFDARKKMLRDKEVFDYLALGWRLLPRSGKIDTARVRVNFPPDLERVERRLQVGKVVNERVEERHPQTNALLAIVFEYEMAARASVMVTADHDNAMLRFRLSCVAGMEIVSTNVPAAQLKPALLDEFAKLIVGEPSRFL